ncbi:hemerythrin domain-containing protein [Mycolicibacterium sediminis]|uniref:Hemerythrin n=1 Tax=Mycolicibacterium sediminis TaxID=1286180 RepID=A0A7I7QTH1_9MYCO|nr:hemerythrin domain-containing protein [Mycolicibacterium sediminis]BBY29277.1 hemerythrin [Mycolicibacterium sediminis]
MVETFVQSTDDVVRFLKDQHNLIRDMFEEVFSASTTRARETAFTELRQLLVVHETSEEMVVHPVVRREVDGGDLIVDARLKEEHDAKEHLSALDAMDVGSDEFIADLVLYRGAVIDHAEREEIEEFDKLEREVDAADLKRMAAAVVAAQTIAPTRPHPGVESAKRNFLVGPVASVLDRARDAIDSVLK